MNEKCIMPECPYCPTCPHGSEVYSESDLEFASMTGDLGGTNPKWICDLIDNEEVTV